MTKAAFLKELAELAVEAERLGVLTLARDTIASLVAGKPDEARRRAERGAKAALARKVVNDA